jgi:hypothetical protein
MPRLRILAPLVLVALTGCARQPPASGGGAGGWRADRARQGAEAVALNAFAGAAEAQAKAVPELRREPKPSAEQVREQLTAERLPAAVRGVGGFAAVAFGAFLFLRFGRGARAVWLALLGVVLAAGGVAAAVLA